MREGEKVNRKGRAFPSHCYPCGNDRFPMIRRVSCNKIPAGIFDPVPLYFDRNRPIVVEKFQRLFDWNPVPRNTPEHNETGRFWRLSDRFLPILAAGTIDLGFLVLFSSALCLFLISTIITLDQLLSLQLKSFCQTAKCLLLLCIYFSFEYPILSGRFRLLVRTGSSSALVDDNHNWLWLYEQFRGWLRTMESWRSLSTHSIKYPTNVKKHCQ